MIQMRWTTYVLTLLAVAIAVGLWSLPGALNQANAQAQPGVRTRPAVPATVGQGEAAATPTYLVEQFSDVPALQQGLNARARQGYLVVSIQSVPTRVGNPADEVYRVAYRNTLDVYASWVVVFTR